MNNYLVIAPVNCKAIRHSKTADGAHVVVNWWLDLTSLNGVVLETFKIQVTQDDEGEMQTRPKIFVSHIIKTDKIEDAINEGVSAVQSFLNHLSVVFEYGFKIDFDRTLVLDCTRHQDIEISKVFVLVENEIITGYRVGEEVETKVSLSHTGLIKHDKYLSTYFIYTNSRAQNLSIDVKDLQLSLEDLPPDKNIKLIFNAGDIENVICTLWVESITCPDIVQSFTRLWQIVEIIQSNGSNEPLLDEDELEKIKRSLAKTDLEKNIIQDRIISILKGLPKMSFIEKTNSGLQKMFPTIDIGPFEDVLRDARSHRGRYIHLREEYLMHPNEFYETYFRLKDFIKSIIRSIKKDILINDKKH